MTKKENTIKVEYFISALLLMFIVMMSSIHHVSESSIDKVEDYIHLKNLPGTVETRINENTTIKEIYELYDTYPEIGRMLLTNEIRKICGS